MTQIRKLERDLNQLKQMLKGNGITNKTKKKLKKLGIDTQHNKGHYLLTDGERQYYCASTPSDHRNGRNIYTGIRQTFFPQSYQTN